jgi:NAD(P)H-hydrate epimerase
LKAGAVDLYWLTVSQMREVDRVMVEEIGVPLERMSENAGRGLAEVSRRMLGGDTSGARILVLAGTGGNGAGGLVAARQLTAAGARVDVRYDRLGIPYASPFGRGPVLRVG